MLLAADAARLGEGDDYSIPHFRFIVWGVGVGTPQLVGPDLGFGVV